MHARSVVPAAQRSEVGICSHIFERRASKWPRFFCLENPRPFKFAAQILFSFAVYDTPTTKWVIQPELVSKKSMSVKTARVGVEGATMALHKKSRAVIDPYTLACGVQL